MIETARVTRSNVSGAKMNRHTLIMMGLGDRPVNISACHERARISLTFSFCRNDSTKFHGVNENCAAKTLFMRHGGGHVAHSDVHMQMHFNVRTRQCEK